MIALTEFLRFVYPMVPTASEPSAVNALRQAAIDFYMKSNLWTEVMDPITATANVGDYDLEFPKDAQLSTLMSVSYDGRPIKPRSHDELDKIYAAQDWVTLTGQPLFYTQFTDDALRLVPMPSATLARAIMIRASYMPSMTATTVPDELFNSYAADIGYGAVAALMREQDREYSDKNMSVMYEQKFRSAIDVAKIMANRGRVRAPMRVRYVRM